MEAAKNRKSILYNIYDKFLTNSNFIIIYKVSMILYTKLNFILEETKTINRSLKLKVLKR